nr:reverse transcriptase domain-containing protein [Tanacetum cinerariifolium]
MMAMLKQFQSNPPPAQVKAVEEICVTCGDQDYLNATAGGNLLEKSPQDALTIIENKSKVRNSRSKPIASPVNACDINSSSEIAKLTHAVNQQTSAMTTVMTAMLKQLQSNPPPAQVKAVEEICITCRAAGNYNQGNPGYRPQGVANQMRPPGFAQPNVENNQNRFGPPQGFNRGPNFNQEQPCQATQSNQNFHLNELEKIKRMNDLSLKAMRNQIDMMNTASTSGSGTLLGNTIANPKGELEAITTRSGLVTDGPTIPNPPKSVNQEEDECVEETYTDPDLAEYTIKVPPPPVQKPKPPIQRNFVLHIRDSPPPHIPELKCKALVNLGASINLMPLSVWKKLGLPDLIPTRLTLELANRAICTPDGITRDVFILVGKFTFPADFVVVDYESDPRVPLILGRPFLRTARALINVHGEEMILRDGDERLTLNMKHDTASYSNHPLRDSINLINIFNLSSEDCLEDLVSNKQSGNPTFSLHKEIASPKVIHEIHDSKGCNFLSEELPSFLEEFADELALITYPPYYDDNRTCDIESDLREIEFLLYQGEDSDFKDSIDQSDLANCDDLFVDPTPEMGEKIKESELLIDQLDLPCDILSEYDSFNSQDFSRDDDLPSPDNEDKDFDPPFYELLVFKEVPNSMRLLPFSSENEEKVFKPGIYTSKKVHFCFLPELSHL